MIGMSQIKRKFYTGLGVGLGVGLVAVAGVAIWSAVTVKSYQEGTNKKYLEKFTKEIYVTNQDIIQGQTITNDMLTPTRVHINMVPTDAISSVDDNYVAKYNIGSNIPIIGDMITEEIIDKDLRETEINTILLPTNLVEGAFVDIRIQFPNGTDYVVLPELQVKKILGETMWFDLTEEERFLLNSAIVDTYLNDGTKLYAIEYVDQMQIDKAQDNVEEIVKGELQKLIKAELPELYTQDYETMIGIEADEKKAEEAEKTETEEQEKDDEKTEEQDWLLGIDYITESMDELEKTTEELAEIREKIEKDKYEETIAAEKAEMIFNFIQKYRNLIACTTSTAQTYQPTTIVRNAMQVNPNITKEAIEKLNAEVREQIEALNTRTTTEYSEEEQGKLVSGAESAISAQKTQRGSVMSSQE